MVLSPVVAALFEDQLRVLRQTQQMVEGVIADYQYQLNYLDPSIGNAYAIAYRVARDGEICRQALNDLVWDLFAMYGEMDRLPRRVFHRNGTTQ